MNITDTVNEKEYILKIDGEIDLNTVQDLEVALQESVDSEKDVVIDMSDVKFIDSTGIGLLVSTHKKLSKNEKTITIKNARENVRKVFKITCLEDTFNMGV